MPTASATLNNRESMTGRWSRRFAARTPNHEDRHDLRHENPKLPQAAREVRFGDLPFQAGGDAGKFRIATCTRHEHAACSAADRGAGKQGIAAFADGSVGGAYAWGLQRGKGFARQVGFADVQVAGLQHDTIGRYKRTRPQADKVARDDVFRRQVQRLAATDDAHPVSQLVLKRLHRTRSAPFLRKADRATEDQDHNDDQGFVGLSGHGGNDRRRQENQHQGAGELAEEKAHAAGAVRRRDSIGSVENETLCRRARRQPVFAA